MRAYFKVLSLLGNVLGELVDQLELFWVGRWHHPDLCCGYAHQEQDKKGTIWWKVKGTMRTLAMNTSWWGIGWLCEASWWCRYEPCHMGPSRLGGVENNI